jgi:hypothetical protein
MVEKKQKPKVGDVVYFTYSHHGIHLKRIGRIAAIDKSKDEPVEIRCRGRIISPEKTITKSEKTFWRKLGEVQVSSETELDEEEELMMNMFWSDD